MHNGDGLCYHDLQKELVGACRSTAPSPRAQMATGGCTRKIRWPVSRTCARAPAGQPQPRHGLGARPGRRNPPSGASACGCTLDETPEGLRLTITDEDGHSGSATHSTQVHGPLQDAKDPSGADAKLREHLSRLGDTIFEPLRRGHRAATARGLCRHPQLNALRRDAVEALEAPAPPPGSGCRAPRPVEPPALPGRHADLPGQRVQPQGARLLRDTACR
jgi:hypothetical protein